VAVVEGAAAAACLAANLDDALILSVFFARRDERFRTRQIILGQYLGCAVILAISVVASIGLIALPDQAVGVLGFAPVWLGLRGFWRARHGGDAQPSLPRPEMSASAVALVTIASGGDSIAVYAPFFATLGAASITPLLMVFLALTALSCLLGFLVGSRPLVARAARWAGPYAVPSVLVGVGVYVIVESGLADLLLR
jgi:cadmium resistance protein CadD (predicted permease)